MFGSVGLHNKYGSSQTHDAGDRVLTSVSYSPYVRRFRGDLYSFFLIHTPSRAKNKHYVI